MSLRIGEGPMLPPLLRSAAYRKPLGVHDQPQIGPKLKVGLS
jgi:hypothetical protein